MVGARSALWHGALGDRKSGMASGEPHKPGDAHSRHQAMPSRFEAQKRGAHSKGPELGVICLPIMEDVDINLRVADYYGRTTLTKYRQTRRIIRRWVPLPIGRACWRAYGASTVFAGHGSARIDYLRIEHAGRLTPPASKRGAFLTLGLVIRSNRCNYYERRRVAYVFGGHFFNRQPGLYPARSPP